MAVRGTTPDYTLTLAGYDMTGQRPYVTIRQGSTQLTLIGDRLAVTVDENGLQQNGNAPLLNGLHEKINNSYHIIDDSITGNDT